MGGRTRPVVALVAAAVVTVASCSHYADRHPDAPVRVVAFGDSITEGKRDGVGGDETFVSIVEDELRNGGIDAGIRNAGVGGQTTEMAMERYDADVLEGKPRVVTILFGSNDSFVDEKTTSSRVSLDVYRRNLESMIDRARAMGIRPILMTPPRWGPRPVNGLRENPNPRLEPYVAACREIAAAKSVPLVDNYADWKAAEGKGQSISAWTVDDLHPNPAGHRRIAELLLPVLRAELGATGAP